MNSNAPNDAKSPEALKRNVQEQLGRCRARLAAGEVNMANVEKSVRAYCESIASLPREEGRLHQADLEALMVDVTKLGEEFARARDAIRLELESLGRVRQANTAYQKIDAIGGKRKPRNNES